MICINSWILWLSIRGTPRMKKPSRMSGIPSMQKSKEHPPPRPLGTQTPLGLGIYFNLQFISSSSIYSLCIVVLCFFWVLSTRFIMENIQFLLELCCQAALTTFSRHILANQQACCQQFWWYVVSSILYIGISPVFISNIYKNIHSSLKNNNFPLTLLLYSTYFKMFTS